MKKVEIIVASIAVILCSLIAGYLFFQTDDTETLMATPTTIRFEKDTLQLGTVKYGHASQVVFRFVNTGKAPLLIRDVQTSCGCTSAKWEKHPIKPGDSGEINISFDPTSLGYFLKNIAVHCNTEERVINLKICGSVIE